MNRELVRSALALTLETINSPSNSVSEALNLERFVAEFVAESESLEGHVSTAATVLGSRDALILA